MDNNPVHPFLLNITVLIFLFAILIVFVIYMRRIVNKKEDRSDRGIRADIITDSFQMLGNELKSLREQLIIKERLATIGEVSAGIAHEFRNPMGVIMGYATLLLKSFEDGDNRRELVQSIIKEIDGMNMVMDELLKFSKSEPVKKTEVDLAKILKEAANESIRPHDITFDCENKFVIRADSTLLKQAVKNLLNNALYAGRKTLLSVEEGQSSGRKGVFIEITDNGRGIPAEELKKIFTPFYSTKQEGLGIGLSLVQKIAMAHEGNVEATSVEGKGSTFRIFLPY